MVPSLAATAEKSFRKSRCHGRLLLPFVIGISSTMATQGFAQQSKRIANLHLFSIVSLAGLLFQTCNILVSDL